MMGSTRCDMSDKSHTYSTFPYLDVVFFVIFFPTFAPASKASPRGAPSLKRKQELKPQGHIVTWGEEEEEKQHLFFLVSLRAGRKKGETFVQ